MLSMGVSYVEIIHSACNCYIEGRIKNRWEFAQKQTKKSCRTRYLYYSPCSIVLKSFSVFTLGAKNVMPDSYS